MKNRIERKALSYTYYNSDYSKIFENNNSKLNR